MSKNKKNNLEEYLVSKPISDYTFISNIDEGEDPKVIAQIESKILKILSKAKSEGKINSLSTTCNNAQNITIKDAFNDFIEYKKTKDKISEATVSMYLTAYKYLLLFCKEDTLVHTFTNTFFKTMSLKLEKFPKNTLKIPQYQNLSYEEIIKSFKTPYETLNNKTINGIMGSFYQIFERFKYSNYTTKNPVEYQKLKVEDDPYLEFTIKEINTLIDNIKYDQTRDLIIIALYSGMRIHEIVNLRKKDINIKEGIINISNSKTINGIRVLPIHSKISDIISHYYIQTNDYLFENGNVNAITKKVNRHIKEVLNIKKKTFHSLRKSFTSQLYKYHHQNKIAETLIKVLIGHSTKNNLSFNIYNANKAEIIELKRAIEMVEYDIVNFPNYKIKLNLNHTINLNF